MLHNSSLPAYHPLAKAVALALFATLPIQAVADTNATTSTTSNNEYVPHTELEEVVIQAGPGARPENKDITGLGQITKTAETLKEQQVESIRDLTRYDAGVAVNEASGRGTSTGFSIRGAEKDRVAITIDGLTQAEAIKAWGGGSGIASGGINEPEYENLKLVEISKGANSTYAGSGALGGAVLMQTKDASDFLSDDKNFGGRVKLGYTSKDQRKVGVVGLGGRQNNWEGFLQYTKRQGHELRPHDDIYNLPPITVDNVITSVTRFDDRERLKPTQNILSWVPKEESITFSPEEYTGIDRKVPNPLDYDSQSLLSKIGYHINEEHYLGLVLEDTQQTYDLRDMFSYGYHASGIPTLDKKELIKSSNTFGEVAAYRQNTPVKFIKEDHHSVRKGLEYKYRPTNQTFITELNAGLDFNTIDIDTSIDVLNCSKYPTIDRNCTVKNVGDYKKNETVNTVYKNSLFSLDAKKDLEVGSTHHDIAVNAGFGKGSLKLDQVSKRHMINTEKHTKHNYNGFDFFNYDVPVHFYNGSSGTGKDKVTDIPIVNRKNYFIGINDNIQVLDNLNLSTGVRFDKYSFTSDQGIKDLVAGPKEVFEDSDYKHTSWNLGVLYYPLDDLELVYKYSTGFRVPSMSEQLGFTPFEESKFPQQKMEKETAKNHELGLTYYLDFGQITSSYFRTDYDNFITFGEKKSGENKGDFAFFNLQSAKVHGFDIALDANLNAIWNKIPLGVEGHISAGMVKMREKPTIHPDYITKSYALDMIQPLKVVYGLSYNSINGKWGASLINTYSQGKDTDELDQINNRGWVSTDKTNEILSSSWITTDLAGYYHITDNITMRGGIYNLFNNSYLNWESARAFKGLKEDLQLDKAENLNPYLLAAPGRNYGLSLEFTF